MGLRIAVLSRNFSTTGGGAERYSIAVVEQLAARHEIHVFAQSIAHQFPGVTYHRVGAPLKWSRWLNQLYYATVTWWATRKQFDIVHSHENTWHGNVQTVHVLPIKYNLFFGVRVFNKVSRYLKVATSVRLIAYLCLERRRYVTDAPRKVVVASHWLLRAMQKTYPTATESMSVISPGIVNATGQATPELRAAARHRLGLPAQGYGLLFVGNDCVKKGLPVLLRALKFIPSSVYVAVVSNAENLDPMRQIATQEGVMDRLYFLGAVSDMDTAYCAADCLVHPTLEDSYAMVVLEAMSHALPVIVSGPKFCGISDDLVSGVNAELLSDPRDSQELAEVITRLLGNPLETSAMAKQGLQFAGEHLWSATASRYEQLFLALKDIA